MTQKYGSRGLSQHHQTDDGPSSPHPLGGRLHGVPLRERQVTMAIDKYGIIPDKQTFSPD